MEDFYQKGIDYFNRGYFFEAHDTFEELWMDDRDGSKAFYQGLVQLSTGFYHLVMKNLKGAESQLSKGVDKLSKYEPRYRDMNVTGLIKQARACLDKIRETNEEPPWDELVDLIPTMQVEWNINGK